MSQRITLERIDLRTALKFGFVLGAVLSLILALLYLVIGIGAVSMLSPYGNPFATRGGAAGIGALAVSLIIFVILASLSYAITVWLMAVIYNLVAKFSGGLIFYVSGINAASAQLPMPAPIPATPSYNPLPAPMNMASNPIPMPLAPMNSMPAPLAQTPAPTFQATANVQASPMLVGVSNPMLRVELSRPVTRIGSANGNDLIIPSARVAAHHAEIRIENGRYILHDVSNGMGVMVNQRQVQGSNMLKNGFQVALGDTTFVFQQ